ncbi:MAG: hypothetical protein ACOCW2_04950, partial [Chitinivibrionales bacterium]
MRHTSAIACICTMLSIFSIHAQNLISGGGFEQQTEWGLYIDESSSAQASISYPTGDAPQGSSYARIDVTQAGTTDMQVQFQLPLFTCEQDVRYTLSFQARGPHT